MSSHHNIFVDKSQALRGEVHVRDPGNGGTFDIDPNVSHSYSAVKDVTAGGTRILPPAGRYAPATRFVVIADTIALSVTLSQAGGLQLNTAGGTSLEINSGHVEFVVVKSGGANQWRISKGSYTVP